MSAAAPIWKRVASPGLSDLSPEAARAILRMKFDQRDVERIHELSAKSKQGTLTDTQRGQLDLYLQIGHILTLMHSKARMALKSGGVRKQQRKSA
jgi:hypothetical protein